MDVETRPKSSEVPIRDIAPGAAITNHSGEEVWIRTNIIIHTEGVGPQVLAVHVRSGRLASFSEAEGFHLRGYKLVEV